ncbi:MAG: glycosyltransferase family 39 protein [bacterium]|nr:glycosyltransferase family 39 protein [bacterium]
MTAIPIGRRHVYILTLLALLLFFTGLGRTDLWGDLVARNAWMAREMLQRGEWIVPYVNGHPDHEKPILWIWVLALFSIPLGVNEFSVRLPTALAALGSVYAVYALGGRIAGPRCGFRAALIYMTGVKVMHMARTPRIDMSLTLLIALVMLSFWRGYADGARRRSAYLLAAVFAALAFLDKGPVGVIVPAGGILLFLLAAGDLRQLRALLAPRNIIAFIAVAAPWYLAVSLRTAGAFPREFFLHRNVTVFAAYTRSQPFWYYVPRVAADFLPWSVFLPFAIAGAVAARRDRRFLFPLSWFAWVFLFFSISVYKRGDYLLPLYPAAALLTALFWGEAARASGGWRVAASRVMVCLLIAVVVAALAAVVLVRVPGLAERVVSSELVDRHSNERDRDSMRAFAGIIAGEGVLLAAFLGAAAVFLACGLRRIGRPGGAAGMLIAGIAAVMAGVHVFYLRAVLPELDRATSVRPYTELLRRTVRRPDPFALYDFWLYEFGYYMEREVTELNVPEDLRAFFAEPGVGYVLVRRRRLDDALAILVGLPHAVEPALGDPAGKFAAIVRPASPAPR